MIRNLTSILVLLFSIFVLFLPINLTGQTNPFKTYCNPINIDYTYMIFDAHNNISYRSGADPAVVEFKDEYYMFVTRSMGYWHSTDLNNWTFIKPESWYFEGSNAPAAFNYKDSVLYMTGNPSGAGSILFSENPKSGKWLATPSIVYDLQDPAIFIDDDGKTYQYWGSSNLYPIRARELNKSNRFRPSDKIVELINLQPEKHGWERFGENHSDTILGGYIEGPWITKYKDKFYLQYAAPGTEFNVYGDGVYISKSPMGPFKYAPNNPVSYKPGGFINGGGHGSTVVGPGENYWHFATMSMPINVRWERRIGMFPTFFDADGLMYCNNSFGDYPHFAPSEKDKFGEFAGWMLLSYKKPVTASSQLKEFSVKNIVDENVKTFWVAEKNNDKQWIEIDLEKPGKVHAIQTNYNDYKTDLYGKIPGLYHSYLIEGSLDGENWNILVDRKNDFKDVPNDYVELEKPVVAQFIRYKNIHVPTTNLSISGLRIFGGGQGKSPLKVTNFEVVRNADHRDVNLSWDKQENTQGYNIHWGIQADKLYNSWLVYENNFLEIKSLSTDQEYYFTIEAFNDNGISEKLTPVEIK